MTEDKTKFCPRCGTMIPYEEKVCPLCGEEQPSFPGMSKGSSKRVWAAIVLSLLVTGLGHLYIGEWRRGLGFFGLALAVSLLARSYMSLEQLFILGLIIAVMAAIDVYGLSKKRQ